MQLSFSLLHCLTVSDPCTMPKETSAQYKHSIPSKNSVIQIVQRDILLFLVMLCFRDRFQYISYRQNQTSKLAHWIF